MLVESCISLNESSFFFFLFYHLSLGYIFIYILSLINLLFITSFLLL